MPSRLAGGLCLPFCLPTERLVRCAGARSRLRCADCVRVGAAVCRPPPSCSNATQRYRACVSVRVLDGLDWDGMGWNKWTRRATGRTACTCRCVRGNGV